MRVFVVMVEMVVGNFFFDVNRYRFLLDDFFDDFLLFYDDRLVMMVDILHLCMRMFVMGFPHRHMNDDLFLMIAAKVDESKIEVDNIEQVHKTTPPTRYLPI